MKDDSLYLIHISECIARIERYVAEGQAAFLDDTKTQDAVLRNLQTLAESTQRLSPELRATYAAVDWAGIAGFRNVLVHDYLGVNLGRIWEIITDDLPDLGAQVEAMLRDLGGEDKPDESPTDN